jgi:hypothetical protein
MRKTEARATEMMKKLREHESSYESAKKEIVELEAHIKNEEAGETSD